MAYALVGSLGTPAVGSVDTAFTPAYGQSPTAGNLLICWYVGFGSTTAPTTPTGWGFLSSSGTAVRVGLFYKIATGGDAAPTITAEGSTQFIAMLGEFQGNFATQASILDKNGVASGTAATETATASGDDASIGELIILAGLARYSSANTVTIQNVLNNGTSSETNNGSTSTDNHFSFGWAIGTSRTVADTNSWSTSTATNLTASMSLVGSFKLAPVLGSAAIALPALDVAATSQRTVFGTVSVELGVLDLTASGSVSGIVTGTASVSIGSLDVSTTGTRTVFGSAAVHLGALTITATSKRTVFGSVDVVLGALDLAAVGSSAVPVQAVPGYLILNDLSAWATLIDIAPRAVLADLSSYAESSDLSSYVETKDVAPYVVCSDFT